MNAVGKTIQIFLPTGDASGLRLAEITTRIVQVVEVPRSQLDAFLARPEAKEVGAYFLISRGETEGDDQRVYVGETEELGTRLKQHHAGKEFWDRALCVISRTRSLTKTHVKFLEWLCITQIQEAGRFQLENGNAGGRPHTSEPLEAEINEVFDTARTLLTTLGYPLFDPLVSAETKADAKTRFYCTGPGNANAEGYLTNEGFVVLKGSTARVTPVKSFFKHSFSARRQKLVESGKLVDRDGRLWFEEDLLYNSPSAAAAHVLGRAANGWTEWKTRDGVTLDQMFRDNADSGQDPTSGPA